MSSQYKTLVQPPNFKYQVWVGSNMMGQTWTVKVGNTQVVNKPINWNGSGNHDMSITTDSNANMTFQPGELKVLGLKSLSGPVSTGYVVAFDGTSGAAPCLGSDAGQSSWQYVPDNSTGKPWVGLVNDLDVVSITFGGAFGSNNGRHGIGLAGSVMWPLPSISYATMGRFFSSDGSQTAKTITLGGVQSIIGSSLGHPFGYFVLRTKGVNQARTATGTLNPMPVFASCDGNFRPMPLTYDGSMQDIDFQCAAQSPNSSTEIQALGTAPLITTFYGNYDVAAKGSDNNGLILRDIPRQPLVSLGQFMHLQMRNSMGSGQYLEIDENNALMATGGSLCNPFLSLNATSATIAGGSFAMDDNFLMNEALFDSYFFSTVPATNADASCRSVYPWLFAGTTAFTAANIQANSCILPNARMQIYSKNGTPPALGSSAGALQNYQSSAANLLLDGAFNINSTSVPAWAALLSSLSGNSVSYLNNGAFTNIPAATLMNPIFRFTSLVQADILQPPPVNTMWGGARALSDAEVESLATEIVKQVKLRGPFLSMADFLNRRLDPNNNPSIGLGFKGAIQAAIDNTDINSALVSSGMTSGTIQNGYRIRGPQLPNQLPSNTAIGIPGWLMQQDVVQCFSPAMAARSDTFIVRVYGDVRNPRKPATPAEACAWGEAVIQRFPEFLDQSDPLLAALGDATPIASLGATNKSFGRRFKIISFRWLNQNEI